MLSGLTSEQDCFAKHGHEVFVIACPGAGKTRTILARVANISKSLPPRKGIAVLSFTNSAVDEFISRSSIANLAHVLSFPSFIGTFDSFVRRFLFFPSQAKVPPQVLDSWSSLGVELRLNGSKAFRGEGVSLDRYDPLKETIHSEAIGKAALKNHVDKFKEDYIHVAKNRLKGLNGKGYYSAQQLRGEVISNIRSKPRLQQALGKALAARYEEIIVDEGQDCNIEDLEILDWLRSVGLRVTLVCDPNQAIFEFRGSTQVTLSAFAAKYCTTNQLKLTGSFRCSPAICALAKSLKTDGAVDTAVGASATVNFPVVVFPYHGRPQSEIGRRFCACLEQKSILKKNSIVLAHNGSVAQQAAGGTKHLSTGQSNVSKLANAISQFWTNENTQSSKRLAIDTIEKLILEHYFSRESEETVLSVVNRININGRHLRRQAIQVVNSIPKTCHDSDAARIEWVRIAKMAFDGLGIDHSSGRSLNMFFRLPNKPDWSQVLYKPEVQVNELPHATVHFSKGREYDAVCVVIPPDSRGNKWTSDLISNWDKNEDTESKRVIYVAATRARLLTVLAIPDTHLEMTTSILERSGVPYVVEEEQSENT